jgi:hypothetical protein
MRINRPENSYTKERFVHRYVHPSGFVRWRFLYQKKGDYCQKYFDTLEDAIAFRDQFMYKLNHPIIDENIFNVSFT